MGDRIIYSTLCALQGSTPSSLDPVVEMARIWADHLLGPGQFEGRILLLTNVPGLRVEGTEAIPAPIRAEDRVSLFLERVHQSRCLPVGPEDLVMQMDLDAMAVEPVDPLFRAIRPGMLMASPSGLPAMDEDQAGGLLSRAERRWYRLLGRGRCPGVSACVTACDGRSWPRLMRRWSDVIRARCRDRPIPPLGDQSVLNLLLLNRAVRVGRLPESLIHHVKRPGVPTDAPGAVGASVLHFPMADRLAEMRRWSRV